MSGTAGYGATVKKSGTSTSFTDEGMSNTSENTWQIDDQDKEVFDRHTVPTFKDNTVVIDSADIQSIDYLYGLVTFTGSKSGPITVSGDYIPMTEIVGAKDVSLNRTSAILDDTDISNEGYHTKKSGIHDASITLGRWDDISHAFTDVINARTSVVIEVAPSSSKSYRGWFVAESSAQNLDLNALIDESVSFQLDGDDEPGKTFSRSDA
jgi:hypothetical protein